MKIKTLRVIAGPWGTFQPGEIAELPDHVALAIIADRGGEAVEVKVATAPIEIAAELSPASPVETATSGPDETQEFPSRRRKKV
jgi:hypothetical protein